MSFQRFIQKVIARFKYYYLQFLNYFFPVSKQKAVTVLLKELHPAIVETSKMQRYLRSLNLQEREIIARKTQTMVQYYGKEARLVTKAEETAAMRAIPHGHNLNQLTGINVGAGGRIIDPRILAIDVNSGDWALKHGSHLKFTSKANFRAWAHALPFKPNSVDFIIALHILEHCADPISTIKHWLDIIRPGGGVGIILPDWRYTWDARLDTHPWSHRWNADPEILKKMFKDHLAKIAYLEHIDTYPYKMSFDIVLRKKGKFVPFDATIEETLKKIPTGKQLAKPR